MDVLIFITRIDVHVVSRMIMLHEGYTGSSGLSRCLILQCIPTARLYLTHHRQGRCRILATFQCCESHFLSDGAHFLCSVDPVYFALNCDIVKQSCLIPIEVFLLFA